MRSWTKWKREGKLAGRISRVGQEKLVFNVVWSYISVVEDLVIMNRVIA
jgi:hypothetical protein